MTDLNDLLNLALIAFGVVSCLTVPFFIAYEIRESRRLDATAKANAATYAAQDRAMAALVSRTMGRMYR